MKNNTSLRCLAAAVAIFLLGGIPYAQAAPTGSEKRSAAYNDSGVQLNRMRQYLEYQRTQQKIAEERQTDTISDERNPGEEKGAAVSFVLKEIKTDKSAVLSVADIEAVTNPWIGKTVTIDDLYTITNEINQLYAKKGYITCKAILAPQTIHDGSVAIELIEGKTGTVMIEGNDSTRADYITSRIHLDKGQIASVHDLNKDLLRFNATNDAQAHLSLKAGKEPGTTDYIISLAEPQKEIFGIFADNAGYSTSGLYRGGMYWQDRSLLGNRDSLFLSTVFSKGTKSFASSYTAPINHHGAKAGLSYSTNSVHIIDGPLEPLNVRSHSYAYNFFATRPVQTTETLKSEVGLEYNYQHSQTSFLGMPWVNDRLSTFHIYYDQLHYGKNSAWYQKHGYRFGRYTNINDVTRNYGKYELNTLYQKYFRAGQVWTLRLDGQLSSTQYLPSAEMFYLGGLYSVRGYKESLIGGDGGFMASAEYAVPVTKNKKTSAFAFLDGGRVWGSSAFGDRSLLGAGIGIKSDIGNHASFNVALGFPLIRTINDEEQSRARVHFSFNSSF